MSTFHTTRTALAAIAATAALAVGATVGLAKPQAVDYLKHGKCFPAAKWNAADHNRPCARITKVYEDGSVRVRVSDYDREARYSVGIGARDR